MQLPESLVGKILHKFEVEGQEEWFSGCVLSYNIQTHLHEVAYDQEDEHHFFFYGRYFCGRFEDIINRILLL